MRAPAREFDSRTVRPTHGASPRLRMAAGAFWFVSAPRPPPGVGNGDGGLLRYAGRTRANSSKSESEGIERSRYRGVDGEVA